MGMLSNCICAFNKQRHPNDKEDFTPNPKAVETLRRAIKSINHGVIKNAQVFGECAVGDFTIVLAQFPGATNYEGCKTLVYRTEDWKTVKASKLIDPHFCDKHPSPVARFVPTAYGSAMAEILCTAMTELYPKK